MAVVHDYVTSVLASDIDPIGHASNISYLIWMQAAALSHSEAFGWPALRYLNQSVAWVVKRHEIDYHLSAQLGDELIIRTWIMGVEKASSWRGYEIHRRSDRALLVEARTRWAFIDLTRHRPMRVPQDIRAAFEQQATGTMACMA